MAVEFEIDEALARWVAEGAAKAHDGGQDRGDEHRDRNDAVSGIGFAAALTYGFNEPPDTDGDDYSDNGIEKRL